MLSVSLISKKKEQPAKDPEKWVIKEPIELHSLNEIAQAKPTNRLFREYSGKLSSNKPKN